MIRWHVEQGDEKERITTDYLRINHFAIRLQLGYFNEVQVVMLK